MHISLIQMGQVLTFKTLNAKRRKDERSGRGTPVAREQGGEGADFDHSSVVPRGIELVDLPVVDAGVVPGLGFVVLSLVLLRLLLDEAIAVLFHSLLWVLQLQRPIRNRWMEPREVLVSRVLGLCS